MMGVEVDASKLLERQMEKASRQLITHSETGIVVEGLSKPQLKLANCCSPVPGDDVLGFISKTSGIVVHTRICPNLKTLDSKRFINVEWADDITRKYPVWIKIYSMSKKQLLPEVVANINASSIPIAEVKVNQGLDLETSILVRVMVSHLDDIISVLVNLRKISEIYNVEREII